MIQLYAIYLAIFLLAAILGAMVLPRIVKISKEKNLVDEPDKRKVHKTPVPRLGGISFLPILMICILTFNCLCISLLNIEVGATDTKMFLRLQAYAIGALLLFLVGTADDLVGVNFKAKFAAQIAAALCLVASGLYFKTDMGLFGLGHIPEWIGIPITVFMVVYITNAINLIDGVDGLASGICILTLTLYATMFMFLGSPIMTCACAALLGVLIVFFIFNVFGGERGSLKKLFMGDTGSLTLGFAISFMILILYNYQSKKALGITGSMYAAFAPLVIPLLDIIRVVCSRYRDRVPLFMPDKRHIHHKLLRTGLTPRWTMITILLLTIWFIGLNILLPMFFRSFWVVLGNIVSWVIMHYTINYFIVRYEASHPETKEKYRNKMNTIEKDKTYKL